MHLLSHLLRGATLTVLLTLTLPAWGTGSTQDLDAILDRVRDFLLAGQTEQTEAPEVQIRPLDPRLRLAACGTELEVFQPNGARPLGNTSVGVRCPGPQPWTIYLSASVRVFGPVQVASRFLPRGTILSASDLRAERRDLTTLPGGYETELAQLLGKQLQRALRAGEAIPPRALANALLIRRGERVTILARQGGMEVTASGVALSDAALGERLQVRNESSQRLIEGTVVAAHRIEIGL